MPTFTEVPLSAIVLLSAVPIVIVFVPETLLDPILIAPEVRVAVVG